MKFIDGAIVLSLITALLYSASTAFTHGYMGALKLDTDVLDRNLHEILYHGMILCLFPIIIGPIIIFFISLIRSFIITEISFYSRKSFSKARKISKVLVFFSIRRKKKRTSLEHKHYKFNSQLFMVAAFAFTFLCFMAYLEKKGKVDANLLLSEIKSGKYVEVDAPKSNIEAMAYLYCASRNCAALNPTTNEINYFQQEGHIIRQPK